MARTESWVSGRDRSALPKHSFVDEDIRIESHFNDVVHTSRHLFEYPGNNLV